MSTAIPAAGVLTKELWALIRAYAACRIDCDRSQGTVPAAYLKLAESNLRDFIEAEVTRRLEAASDLRRYAQQVVDADDAQALSQQHIELLRAALRAALSAAPEATLPVQQAEPAQPRLAVRLLSFPESNGKRNWTALLVRANAWDGLEGNCGGITIDRGEFWNRVAYAAERAKLLIGERDTEPHILDYGDDIRTPEEWGGEVRGGRLIAEPIAVQAEPQKQAPLTRHLPWYGDGE